MEDLLKTIACGLVENQDDVKIDVDEPDEEGITVYHLHVNESEVGRIIGKQGRIIKAIRVIMRAAGIKNSCKISVNVD